MSEAFDAVDIIRIKRDGGRLDDAQIDWVVDAYTRAVVADEQMAALAMGPDYFLVIAPVQQPSIAAPLGWVLSTTSIEDLDDQLASSLRGDDSEPGSSVCALRQQLVGMGKPCSTHR